MVRINESLEVLVVASDAENDRLEVTWSPLPPGAVFERADRQGGPVAGVRRAEGRLVWNPSQGDGGSHTIVFTATDEFGGTGSYYLNILVCNDQGCLF